jgi:adenosylcobinamide-phosphate synthase
MNTALIMLAAVIIDWLLGEPKKYHPLVGFGWLAHRVEHIFYGEPESSHRRLRGLAALCFLVAPAVILTTYLCSLSVAGNFFQLLALYFALGHKSLHDHARPVAAALRAKDTALARQLVGRMVSRDSAALDITGATTESVLENGNDGVFGALFWFAVAGGAGAVLYRLANTLDAMWGYRNTYYLQFGWAAARFDDVLNYIPARLTAFTYALLGNTRLALHCWRQQAPTWDSPNAGPVMAAGAGALGVQLGGPARYEGEWHERPILGSGATPTLQDIERALQLVRHGVYVWLLILLLTGFILHA